MGDKSQGYKANDPKMAITHVYLLYLMKLSKFSHLNVYFWFYEASKMDFFCILTLFFSFSKSKMAEGDYLKLVQSHFSSNIDGVLWPYELVDLWKNCFQSNRGLKLALFQISESFFFLSKFIDFWNGHKSGTNVVIGRELEGGWWGHS